MERNFPEVKTLGLLATLFVPMALGFVFSQYSYIFSGVILFLVVILGLFFQFRKPLFLSLAFLIPLSWELPFIGGSMIFFPTEPIIGGLFVLLLVDLVKNEIDFWSELKRVWWAIPFVLAFLITTPFSEMIGVSLKFSLVNIVYFSVFFFYLNHIFRQDLRFFGQLITAFSIAFGLVSVWGFYTFYGYDFNPVVIRGIFIPFFKDNTIFAATAGFLAAYWIVRALTQKGFSERWRPGITGVLFLGLVIFSNSRAAWFSLAFATAVYLTMAYRIQFRFVALGAVLLAFGLYFGYGKFLSHQGGLDLQSGHGQASFFERAGSVANITTDVSNLERLNRWHASIAMFSEKPLVGFGPGTYQFVYIPFQNEKFENRLTVTDLSNVPDNSGGTAHSEYLLALSEMGLFGLIGWLAIMGNILLVVFFNKPTSNHRKGVIVGVVMVSTYFFHAFFNNFLGVEKVALLFWASLAFVNVNSEQEDERKIL